MKVIVKRDEKPCPGQAVLYTEGQCEENLRTSLLKWSDQLTRTRRNLKKVKQLAHERLRKRTNQFYSKIVNSLLNSFSLGTIFRSIVTDNEEERGKGKVLKLHFFLQRIGCRGKGNRRLGRKSCRAQQSIKKE